MHYRNPSARTNALGRISAEECFNFVLDAEQVLKKAVQEALAGKTFYKCLVGVVLTNSHFTKAAQELANADGIVLWDRNKLLELIAKAGYTIHKG